MSEVLSKEAYIKAIEQLEKIIKQPSRPLTLEELLEMRKPVNLENKKILSIEKH